MIVPSHTLSSIPIHGCLDGLEEEPKVSHHFPWSDEGMYILYMSRFCFGSLVINSTEPYYRAYFVRGAADPRRAIWILQMVTHSDVSAHLLCVQGPRLSLTKCKLL